MNSNVTKNVSEGSDDNGNYSTNSKNNTTLLKGIKKSRASSLSYDWNC